MSILFLEDWKKYPNAIIDTQTSNRSFVRLAELYKSMGIKNHAFILQLHNKELQGIDPFDVSNLSREQMLAIAYECKINFWYFIREIAMAPSLGGNDAIRFKANRGNIAAYWLFFNHITFILIQIRQTGKSYSIDTLQAALLNFVTTNVKINLLTKDEDLRAKNLIRLKEIINLLPIYLKALAYGDIGNTEEIFIKSLNNRYTGHIANKSPKAALNLGRGLSSALIHCDELSFLYNNEITIPAMLAAGGAARDSAKIKNVPYGTIFTTTAGKKNDRDGKYAYSLVNRAAIWNEALFDCVNLEDLEKCILASVPVIKGEPKLLLVNCTFSHRQLGYTDDWLKDTITRSLSKGEDADRDYFNRWTSGSISSPLSIELLEKINNSKQEDHYAEIDHRYGYIIRWFINKNDIEYELDNGKFIFSFDTSDASGGDDISMIGINVKSGGVVAAATINETNILTFSEWLCMLIVKYPNITVIIERKSTGSSIIDNLLLMLPLKGIDPFKRLYNRCVQDSDEEKERFKEINMSMGRRSKEAYIIHKKTFGFATSGFGYSSRTMLYSFVLQTMAKLSGDKIKDPKTIEQITSLIKQNDRVDHPPGGHDDHVIALLLAYWLLIKGKNLTHYGIESSDILIDNNKHRENITIENSYEYREQVNIRNEIDSIYKDMLNEKDELIYKKLENRLLQLNGKLVLRENENFSMAQLIDNLNKERRVNISNRNNSSSRYTTNGYYNPSPNYRY